MPKIPGHRLKSLVYTYVYISFDSFERIYGDRTMNDPYEFIDYRDNFINSN